MEDGNQGTVKVLTSDANGIAAWSDPPSGGGSEGWIVAGNNVYTSVIGNVGIGTNTPDAKLDVAGRIVQTNTGYSVFLGEGAGENDNLTNNPNVFVGEDAGNLNSEGVRNVAIVYNTFPDNTVGNDNTAVGQSALANNTTGNSNIAFGQKALYMNTDRSNLVAIGDSALFRNGAGVSQPYYATHNTAIGSKALYLNTTGYENTSGGYNALRNNSSGYGNSTFGNEALLAYTTGDYNTAIGESALRQNTTGYNNGAMGSGALYANTSGYQNTAFGIAALNSNTTGHGNTGVVWTALQRNQTGSNNVAIGYEAGKGTELHNKSGGVFLGYNAGKDENGSNKLYIENSSSSTPLIGGDFETNQVDINGTIKITGGNPGTNKVLMSDATGLASWSAQGGGGIGVSMATAYMNTNNMFTPHVNDCGSDAFVPLFSGATVGFCMERDERPSHNWQTAVRTCLAAGKRLPEVWEFVYACENADVFGLNDMVINAEFASNFPQLQSYSYQGGSGDIYTVKGDFIPRAGYDNSCHKITLGTVGEELTPTSTSSYFRCVR